MNRRTFLARIVALPVIGSSIGRLISVISPQETIVEVYYPSWDGEGHIIYKVYPEVDGWIELHKLWEFQQSTATSVLPRFKEPTFEFAPKPDVTPMQAAKRRIRERVVFVPMDNNGH
jgi:hypothetical protein